VHADRAHGASIYRRPLFWHGELDLSVCLSVVLSLFLVLHSVLNNVFLRYSYQACL
jgi:hypothetical protein